MFRDFSLTSDRKVSLVETRFQYVLQNTVWNSNRIVLRYHWNVFIFIITTPIRFLLTPSVFTTHNISENAFQCTKTTAKSAETVRIYLHTKTFQIEQTLSIGKYHFKNLILFLFKILHWDFIQNAYHTRVALNRFRMHQVCPSLGSCYCTDSRFR